MEVRSCPPAEDLALALWSWIVGEDALAAAGERMMRRQGWHFGIKEAVEAAGRLSHELTIRWQGCERVDDWVQFLHRHPELRLHHTDWWAHAGPQGQISIETRCLGGLRHCCTQIAYGLYGEPVTGAAAAVVQALRDAHA
jgi:hypothetical protein